MTEERRGKNETIFIKKIFSQYSLLSFAYNCARMTFSVVGNKKSTRYVETFENLFFRHIENWEYFVSLLPRVQEKWHVGRGYTNGRNERCV